MDNRQKKRDSEHGEGGRAERRDGGHYAVRLRRKRKQEQTNSGAEEESVRHSLLMHLGIVVLRGREGGRARETGRGKRAGMLTLIQKHSSCSFVVVSFDSHCRHWRLRLFWCVCLVGWGGGLSIFLLM